jgi:hypothetical protein
MRETIKKVGVVGAFVDECAMKRACGNEQLTGRERRVLEQAVASHSLKRAQVHCSK